MNKEKLKEVISSLLDEAFLEHTKIFWLDDTEIENIKKELNKAIDNSYVED